MPQDVAVIGFDDNPAAENQPVPLASVNQRVEAVGRSGVELLLRAARGTPLPRRIPGPLAQLVAAWEEQVAARTRPPRVTRGTVRILLRDWPLDNARSIQELNYRITPFDQGINRLLAGAG